MIEVHKLVRERVRERRFVRSQSLTSSFAQTGRATVRERYSCQFANSDPSFANPFANPFTTPPCPLPPAPGAPLLDFFDDGPRTVERKRRRSLAGKVVDYPLDVA